jgi:hypothetical protein
MHRSNARSAPHFIIMSFHRIGATDPKDRLGPGAQTDYSVPKGNNFILILYLRNKKGPVAVARRVALHHSSMSVLANLTPMAA